MLLRVVGLLDVRAQGWVSVLTVLGVLPGFGRKSYQAELLGREGWSGWVARLRLCLGHLKPSQATKKYNEGK